MHELPKQKNQTFEQAFVLDIRDAKTLLQKELAVNQSEQQLVTQRMRLMREFINDLPSTDPQYSMIAVAIQADQIELDELQRRADSMMQKIQEI